MTILRAVAAVLLCALATAVSAGDVGQIPPDVPDHVRAWFKAVRSPKGVPCCDIADGRRLDGDDVDYAGDRTRVRIEGEWITVPIEAEVTDSGNPVGQAVVWYTNYSGKVFIRCFVNGPML